MSLSGKRRATLDRHKVLIGFMGFSGCVASSSSPSSCPIETRRSHDAS